MILIIVGVLVFLALVEFYFQPIKNFLAFDSSAFLREEQRAEREKLARQRQKQMQMYENAKRANK